jgi:hypothetical protein
MGWSGGTFTRVHDWTTDEGSAIDIEASRMDAEDDNFAAGINACLAKDGSNTPSANLPMNGQRHLNVGNAQARTDYSSAQDVQDQHLVYYADSGSANNYIITPVPEVPSYAAGQKFAFKAGNSNVGASNIKYANLAAKSIVHHDGSALVANDIVAGRIYEVCYDGTSFQLVSPSGTNELYKIKSSSTARNSTTTYTADPELTNYYLVSGVKYKVEGFLVVNEASTSGGGFKVKVNGTGIGYMTLVEPIGDTVLTNAITSGIGVPSWGSVGVNCMTITGVFIPNSTGNVSLDWAQNASDGDNTTLNERSWFGFKSLT